MKCAYCGNTIGAWRRVAGSRFCCGDHQKRHSSRSARALRDLEDVYGAQAWTRELHQPKKAEESRRSQPGHVITAMGLTAAGLLGVALLSLPGSGTAPARPSTSVPDYNLRAQPKADFGSSLSRRFGSGTPITLHENFVSGLAHWSGGGETASTWTREGDYVLPGRLRLWQPSTHLSNYELEFLGQIEHKGMGWAFRAPDVRNYYGAKLLIVRPGPLPNADLVRFVVLNGRETERLQLPLPLTLDRGTDYRVHVSVKGSRFLTTVNGQLISSWTDNRLGIGGVGFFSEPGEQAAIRWVSVSERDSMLGRFLSYFSILTFPAALPVSD